MRILIAFDGSECSEAALEDLCHAGLPDNAQAVVFSVAQAPIQSAEKIPPRSGEWDERMGALDDSRREYGLTQAESIAAYAQEWLRTEFPRWQVDREAWIDSAGPAIVRKARDWQPDLIVVGSHGRAALSRQLLGSVSQYVLHHAECAVRICRQHLHFSNRPLTLMVGIDGSPCSRATGEYVASRHWSVGTQALVVGVARPNVDSLDLDRASGGIYLAVEKTTRMLEESGLLASSRVVQGSPADVLISLVDAHAVDCVFAGASGQSAVKRFWIGSVCAALAAQAHCSVEIVRPKVPAAVQQVKDSDESAQPPLEKAGGSPVLIGAGGSGPNR